MRRRVETNIDIEAIGKLHALDSRFKSRFKRAVELAASEISDSVKPYVSVSGGKDSVALLAVVSEAAKVTNREVVAWSHISDASFPGTRETVEEACEIAGLRLVFDESPVSAFEVFGHAGDKRYGKEGYFFGAIKSWLMQGYDLCFTGVRAQESNRRFKAARAHGQAFNTTVPAPHRKCERKSCRNTLRPTWTFEGRKGHEREKQNFRRIRQYNLAFAV